MTTNADREDRRDAAEERAVEARKDRLREAAQARQGVMPEREFLGLQPAVDPIAASWTVMRHALDRTAEAVGIRPGASPAIVEFAIERRLAVADAVLALRTAELNGLTVDSDEWARLMGAVRDRTDEAMGTGIAGRSA